MNKKDLAKAISKKTSYKENDVLSILDVVCEEIAIAIKNDEKVKLHGFGTFFRRSYGERKCYNPISGEIETIPASFQPVFKAGPKLREEINK